MNGTSIHLATFLFVAVRI
uniref:Uncharacterized protein n=1 Tax=Arundo donax TaxID=35708 RepID=A0A0A9CGY2_ARUDO